jgi:hypothetical protein
MSENRFALGRKVQHDPASRNFEHPRRATLPRSVTHVLGAPALDQGSLGACTGFAGAQWLNCAHNIGSRRAWNRVNFLAGLYFCDDSDGRRIYSEATRFDQWPETYPPVDSGSSGLGVAKALKNVAVIHRYEWIISGGFSSFLSALQIQPILLGINWYEQMFYPSPSGLISIGGEIAGGHEVLARGVDYRRKRIRIRNNWTDKWGWKGDAFISFADTERLLAEQGDAMVLIGIDAK